MKFFIDNNLPPAWAKALDALDDTHTVTHLRDKFPPDVTDIDWIQALSGEGGWYIISGDMRISRNQHEREAWLRSGLVGFFLGKSWRSVKYWDQTWRFVRWWPNIVQQAELVTPPAAFEIPFGWGKFRQIVVD